MGAKVAREDLESGFTAVRNLGHSGIVYKTKGDVVKLIQAEAGEYTTP
jgi:hypothetical protein